MWVRSQDFTKLIYINYVCIRDMGDSWWEVWGSAPERSYIVLGCYKNKEAETVLDDIQYAIAHDVKMFNVPE